MRWMTSALRSSRVAVEPSVSKIPAMWTSLHAKTALRRRSGGQRHRTPASMMHQIANQDIRSLLLREWRRGSQNHESRAGRPPSRHRSQRRLLASPPRLFRKFSRARLSRPSSSLIYVALWNGQEKRIIGFGSTETTSGSFRAVPASCIPLLTFFS